MNVVLLSWMAGLLGVGGIGAFASRRTELRRRWLTWVAIAAVLAVASALGRTGGALLGAGCAAVCALEYARLAGLPRPDRLVLVAGTIAVPVVALLAPVVLGRCAVAALVVAALPALFAQDARTGGRRAGALLFGLLWLAPFAGLVLLGDAAVPSRSAWRTSPPGAADGCWVVPRCRACRRRRRGAASSARPSVASPCSPHSGTSPGRWRPPSWSGRRSATWWSRW